jgi:dTDP-4-dehydrorhamnose reductase
MTWLVVGSNGQLGRALVTALNERSIEYHALESKDLDIRSKILCDEQISFFSPTVIINAAAWTDVDRAESDPEGAYAVNTTGVLNLALAAKAVGAVFAHVSTDYVFSGVTDRPWHEKDLRTPVSVYGKTKAEGEDKVLNEYKDGSYIFRTAWLYGKWGKSFAKAILRLALENNGEVRIVNDQVGQPTSSIDLANQIISSILAKLPFGIYHATNSGQSSWFEFAQEIFRLSNQSVTRVIPVSSSEFVRPAKRPAYSVLGHDGWQVAGPNGVTVPPMRDWRIALLETLPEMIATLHDELAREEAYGI